MKRFFAEFVSVFAFALALSSASLLSGCASYKGGRVVDGTNLEVGLSVPGTEWLIDLLSYTGGLKVCGNDQTAIIVSNEVCETNAYFGVIRMQRRSNMKAWIVPYWANAKPATDDEIRRGTKPAFNYEGVKCNQREAARWQMEAPVKVPQ